MESEKKRRRTKPEKFSDLDLSNREEELFQQAVANSRWEKSLPKLPIDKAPIYYPTAEEFDDPLRYIEKIRTEAQVYGICKIVPPEGWSMAGSNIDFESRKEFATKRQQINRLQESLPYSDGKRYTIKTYKEMADAFKQKWLDEHPLLKTEKASLDLVDAGEEEKKEVTQESQPKDDVKQLEEWYWKIADQVVQEVAVEYANDIDIDEFFSGFPSRESLDTSNKHEDTDGERILIEEGLDALKKTERWSKDYYRITGWNPQNIAKWPGSMLKHLEVKLPGINVPWLYLGMLFSTFSWHNEDNYLASMNYHHFGAPKQWYGVPGDDSTAFENVVRRFYKQRLMEVPDLLHNMNTMFSPSKLKSLGVRVYSLIQNPGDFVITFPRAFHSGFSYGFNCGEAVNFATAAWLQYAYEASEKYRRLGRLGVLAHDRMICTLAHHALQEKDPTQIFGPGTESTQLLHREFERVIKEDLLLRPRLYANGVRDLTKLIKPPENSCESMDITAADYDDKRVCSICRHTCFLSAVACNCSTTSVSCLRHVAYLCKCPLSNKYIIEWESQERLTNLLDAFEAHRKGSNTDLSNTALSMPQISTSPDSST